MVNKKKMEFYSKKPVMAIQVTPDLALEELQCFLHGVGADSILFLIDGSLKFRPPGYVNEIFVFQGDWLVFDSICKILTSEEFEEQYVRCLTPKRGEG